MIRLKKEVAYPPVWATRLLRRTLPAHVDPSALGDYDEIFHRMAEAEGGKKARQWFWSQALNSVAPFVRFTLYWRMVMFVNYLKIAVRNLMKHRVYFLINVLGLAVGLGFFLISAFEVDANYSFDAFHKDARRIYGIAQVKSSAHREVKSAVVSAPLLDAMTAEFPEIEAAAKFTYAGRTIVEKENQLIYENRILYADPEFITLFSFPLARGDAATALNGPNAVVMTEEAAVKYFGTTDCLGKSLTVNRNRTVKVTGVLKPVPKNTSIRFSMLFSMKGLEVDHYDNWLYDDYAAFIRLPEGFDPAKLEAKFPAFVQTRYPDNPESPRRLFLVPLLDFHLHANDIRSYLYKDSASIFLVGLATTILFLLVVCFNFMSLSTARYLGRAKEVALRKVVGARRSQLTFQFLGESLLISMVALGIGMIIFQLVKEPFYTMFNNHYDLSLFQHPRPLIYAGAATLFAALMSGGYPAVFVSRFTPAHVFRHKNRGLGRTRMRQVLIVLQYTVAVIILLFSLVLKKQMVHLMNLDCGFSKENVAVIPLTDETRPALASLKKEIVRHPQVTRVSSAIRLPLFWETETPVQPQGATDDEIWQMNAYGVDVDFIELMEMPVTAGRTFSLSQNNDEAFILNESAVRELGLIDPVGKEVIVGDIPGRVIGVVADFQFRNLTKPVGPAIFYHNVANANYLYVKYRGDFEPLKPFLRQQWDALVPDWSFHSFLLSHRFEDAYVMMSQTIIVFRAVGYITMLLSSIGLLGLVSFMLNQRVKEIGIRKVLGAGVFSLSRMILFRYMALVLVANVIAAPLAWLVINQYLASTFALRVGISLDVFVLGLGITFLAALVMIGFRTVKAANANPVQSLRYE